MHKGLHVVNVKLLLSKLKLSQMLQRPSQTNPQNSTQGFSRWMVRVRALRLEVRKAFSVISWGSLIWEMVRVRVGFPGGISGKEPACQCRRCGFDPWVGKISWRRAWQPTPIFLPGESHGQRSLAGYSPRVCRIRQNWSNLARSVHKGKSNRIKLFSPQHRAKCCHNCD